MKKALLYSLFIILMVDIAKGATYTAAAGTNSWGVAAFGATPGVNDDIIVPSGATVNITVFVLARCRNITIQNGGIVQFASDWLSLRVCNGGTFYIAPGGIFRRNGFSFLSLDFVDNMDYTFKCDGVCDMSNMTGDGNYIAMNSSFKTLSLEGSGTIIFDHLTFRQTDATLSIRAGTTLKLRNDINFGNKVNSILNNYGTIYCALITGAGTGSEFHNKSGAVLNIGWTTSTGVISAGPLGNQWSALSVFADDSNNLVNYCGMSASIDQHIRGAVNGYYNLEISYIDPLGGPITSTRYRKLLIGGDTIIVLNQLILTDGFLDLSFADPVDGPGRILILNGSPDAIKYTRGLVTTDECFDLSDRFQWSIDTFKGPHIVPFMSRAQDSIPLVFDLDSGDAGIVTFSTYGTLYDNLNFPTFPFPVLTLDDSSYFDDQYWVNNGNGTVVDRFWYIGVTGGAKANVTFNYPQAELPPAPYNDTHWMQVQRYKFSNDSWDFNIPGQISNGYSVIVNGLRDFSTFAISYKVLPIPLPVDIISFAAEHHNKGIKLNWRVSDEVNISNYVIERSDDGINYSVLETIKSVGSPGQVSEYETLDRTPYTSMVYYRLKKTEAGRVSEPLGQVCFENNAMMRVPSVYPVPGNGEFIRLDYLPAGSPCTIQVMNAEGKVVFEDIIPPDGSDIRFSEKLEKGVYAVSISSARRKWHHVYIVD